MKDKELSAFKDGVADALLEGYKSDWHENLHFYNHSDTNLYSATKSIFF